MGKLQKKLDAELHDAQEDENNAADPIFFNSVSGTLWYLVPGFVKPHTEECRAREGLSSRVRDASERMALAEPEKKRRLQPAETSSSPSSSTPPTATPATVPLQRCLF